uniref:KRAB domain-containing protein n=1 Tax=Salvator merianae TaxID=96440 RepID=A0A8D0BYW8_SALMN
MQSQRALHREVMEENYQNLAFLGKNHSLMRLIGRLIRGTTGVLCA